MTDKNPGKMNGTITRTLEFPQPREAVWAALTEAASLEEWMYPNDFKPETGYRFTFKVPGKPEVGFEGLTVHCEVLECDPPSALSFTWVAGEVDTIVKYRLESSGTGTKVFFEHSGFEQNSALGGAKYGWSAMHEALAALLENG